MHRQRGSLLQMESGPLRSKEDSFRRQMNEWGIVKSVADAKSLPVKMWFTNAQQKQLWNRMKKSIKGSTEGGEAESQIKSQEQKNIGLQCYLTLDGVHWQDYLVEIVDVQQKQEEETNRRHVDATRRTSHPTWVQRSRVEYRKGHV